MTETQADLLYTILVEECGAADCNYRHNFIYYVTKNPDQHKEFRFCGKLGFGGKLKKNSNRDGMPHVDCYSEDMTADREQMIKSANERIKLLFS